MQTRLLVGPWFGWLIGGVIMLSAVRATGHVDSVYAEACYQLTTGDADSGLVLLQQVINRRPDHIDAMLKLGHAYLKGQDYMLARKAFKRALGMAPQNAAAYYGMGLVHLSLPTQRYLAISYFRKALICDPKFVDARFQIAKARYDMKERDAESDIKKVLQIDPHYAEAYLLMGDWLVTVMEDYGQAIIWFARYLEMRSEDADVRRKLGMAYLKVRDYDRIRETLLDYVQKYPDAQALMPIVAQACIQQNQMDMAMHFFKTYIAGLNPVVRDHYEDIRLIASPEEFAVLAQTPDDGRADVLARFWNGRDPDLSTSVNERLLEHYRRVWYALEAFSVAVQPFDRRGEIYIRFGEPDFQTSSQMMALSQNLAVHRVRERLATALYGTAAVGETFAGSVFPVRNFAPERDVAGSEQTAVNNQTGTFLDLGFENAQYVESQNGAKKESATGPGQKAEAQGTSGEAAVRAAPMPRVRPNETGGDPFMLINAIASREAIPMTMARPVTGSGEDLGGVPWQSWIYTGVDGGIEITFTDEFGSGAYDFAPVPSGSEVPVDQMARFERHSPQRTFEQATRLSPDYYAPALDAPVFDFYYSVADFRGANGKSTLEIYFGLPCRPMHYMPQKDETHLIVARQAALIPILADTVYRQGADLVYLAPGNQTGPGAIVPDVVSLDVPPGLYRLEVKAQDRLSGRMGLYRQTVEVASYGVEGLRVSGLEMAWQISEQPDTSAFAKQGLQVIPMPSRTYQKGQNAFVYYEIYNLMRDTFGQTNYEVVYTIGNKDQGSLFSRMVKTLLGRQKTEVAVGYEGKGVRDVERVYTELDLNDVPAGRHYLQVQVRDLISGETVEKETAFVVVE